jgi:hypothetical protein
MAVEHAIIVEYAALARMNGRQVGEHDLAIRCICGWESNKVFKFGQDRKIRREYAKHIQ